MGTPAREAMFEKRGVPGGFNLKREEREVRVTAFL